MDSGKLVEKAVRDLGVTDGPWPLEYDGSLAIGGQICIRPSDAGNETATQYEREANIRLFAVSRELYGHTCNLIRILEEVIAGKGNQPLIVEIQSSIDAAQTSLVAAKNGGAA